MGTGEKVWYGDGKTSIVHPRTVEWSGAHPKDGRDFEVLLHSLYHIKGKGLKSRVVQHQPEETLLVYTYMYIHVHVHTIMYALHVCTCT